MQVKESFVRKQNNELYFFFYISRYVLVTFPSSPTRYNTPSYVERLLLPERFPTLFQNIVHSCEHNRHNK